MISKAMKAWDDSFVEMTSMSMLDEPLTVKLNENNVWYHFERQAISRLLLFPARVHASFHAGD